MSFHNKTKSFLLLLAGGLIFLTACNKELPEPVPIEPPANGTSPTLADLLNDPTFSILKSAVTKSGFMSMLADNTLRFTLFAPDNDAMAASGITQQVVDALPADQLAAAIAYHIVPQTIKAVDIPESFPNFQYPTILNPAPGISPFLRLTTFPSKRGSYTWVNNIPIIAADIAAVNGVLQKVARVIVLKMPDGNNDLWDRINNDPQLTYLKAAITRADSGVAAGSRLLDALSITANPAAIGSNLTVFAPTDDAMKIFLTGAITKTLLAQVNPGPPTAIDSAKAAGTANYLVTTYGTLLLTNPYAISPVLGAAITPTVAKGIVAYHIVSSQSGTYTPPGLRVFSVNLPTSATGIKTLLNSGIASHPGVVVQATFGPYGVTAATVKGLVNTTASNVLINPLPGGSSDQHYLNGVLHKIDQVLLPQ